jgi:hypothetical protein
MAFPLQGGLCEMEYLRSTDVPEAGHEKRAAREGDPSLQTKPEGLVLNVA